ncbi:MAG: transcriptional repressor LexA [Treponema sp.]|jgi:repressor LexA|nr:repressor LexA [Treponema sp.]MBR6296366.1 repressor LexA [Treponema sp.]MEE3314584.1 transcriptional repressor LexA [Treponema sp.]
MKDLTDRQRQVLNFIAQFTDDNVSPPTVREISEHFGISLRAVQDHIAALQKKGFITQSQKRSRSIRVLKDQRKKANIPVPQRVPFLDSAVVKENGELTESTDLLYVAVPFVSVDKSYFAVSVADSSMDGTSLRRGDIAIFLRADSADEGQICALSLDNKVIIRRMYKEPNRIRLESDNPEVQPIFCQDMRVLGVIAGIIREF